MAFGTDMPPPLSEFRLRTLGASARALYLAPMCCPHGVAVWHLCAAPKSLLVGKPHQQVKVEISCRVPLDHVYMLLESLCAESRYMWVEYGLS